jgi:23S rRNA (adenine2503-C2)-methyltransferase
MMKVVHTCGDRELAQVFVAELADGAKIEFVESVQPPIPREDKWVLIVSTLKGCPVGCPICDAGGSYKGKLSAEEIMAQVEYLLKTRYPDGDVRVPKLKIQFARMGDPALNDAVLQVLKDLPTRFNLPGLVPCISTVAPTGRDGFFEELLRIKNELYGDGKFQMQFSLHTTNSVQRRKLVPIKTWSLAQMAEYGDRFFLKGDRKITLNFAAAKDTALDPEELVPVFSPKRFLIKLTPINPTRSAIDSGLEGLVSPDDKEASAELVKSFTNLGYDTILSIGEQAENQIGSNCGMFVSKLESGKVKRLAV